MTEVEQAIDKLLEISFGSPSPPPSSSGHSPEEKNEIVQVRNTLVDFMNMLHNDVLHGSWRELDEKLRVLHEKGILVKIHPDTLRFIQGIYGSLTDTLTYCVALQKLLEGGK